MKTSQMMNFVSSTPKNPPRPAAHFLDVSEKSPASTASKTLAEDIVADWHQDRASIVEAMPMANGGMATYRAKRGDQTFFVKAAIKESLSLDPAILQAQKTKTLREANLAKLAARTTGVAPQVLYIDPKGMGFATEIVNMPEVSFLQAKGSARNVLTKAFAAIHQSEAGSLLMREDGPWWSMVNLEDCYQKASTPKAQASELVQLENALNKAIEKMPFIAVPCHNDLKIRNLLYQDNKAVIVDWDRFSLADPMRDLAYFASTTDIDAKLTAEFLADYKSHLLPTAPAIGNEADRYNLHFAYYLNKKQSFLSQWQPTKPVSEYFARQLVDQLPVISPVLGREVGIRLNLG